MFSLSLRAVGGDQSLEPVSNGRLDYSRYTALSSVIRSMVGLDPPEARACSWGDSPISGVIGSQCRVGIV